MKRHLACAGLLAAGLFLAGGLRAQDATAAAEREQAEERYRSMTTRIDRLEETLLSFQKRLASLREENGRLRDELDRLKSKVESGTLQDSIKHLAEKIEEVDKKRLADGERTARAFEKLEKLILDKPAARPLVRDPDPPPKTPGEGARPGPEPRATTAKGVPHEYVIREKDTLSGIVAKLRAQGVPITQTQVKEANPTVNWDRIRPGQKIIIMVPPP